MRLLSNLRHEIKGLMKKLLKNPHDKIGSQALCELKTFPSQDKNLGKKNLKLIAEKNGRIAKDATCKQVTYFDDTKSPQEKTARHSKRPQRDTSAHR